MDLRLDGKVALVTGSSRGIGKGIAEQFARSDADVTITYEGDKAGAEETAAVVRDQGRRALIVQVDVADDDADRLAGGEKGLGDDGAGISSDSGDGEHGVVLREGFVSWANLRSSPP